MASKVHSIFQLRLKSLDGEYACNFKATKQYVICGDVSCIKPAPWLDFLKEKNIVLTDVASNRKNIDILIGADVAGKLFTGARHALTNGLTAIETLLGWTVMGEPKKSEHEESSALMATSLYLSQADVSDMWKLDTIGIKDPVSKKSEAQRDIEVRKQFRETVKINSEGRYEVQLPWIEDQPPLPSNQTLAKKRLYRTVQKLKNNDNENDYYNVFQEWVAEGVVERVRENELSCVSHYLPHRPVFTESSSTPIRPEFDASAREKNAPSLNQCLDKVPNLIELLPACLLLFRKRKIGIISDIKRAFLQISIASMDRDSLRFLLLNGKVVEMLRHCRVVFGVSCSPFILAAVIELHLQHARNGKLSKTYSERIIDKLAMSFYVDNYICSVDTEQERDEFIVQATSIMDEGRFILRGWEYNGDPDPKKTMVLGMIWDKYDDTLSLNLCFLDDLTPSTPTKRSVLSTTHRIFDPLGVACPVMIRPKLMLQKAWLSNVG